MHVIDDGEEVSFQLPYGEWIRLFRANGFVVEDLIEPQARGGRHQFVPVGRLAGMGQTLAGPGYLAAAPRRLVLADLRVRSRPARCVPTYPMVPASRRAATTIRRETPWGRSAAQSV